LVLIVADAHEQDIPIRQAPWKASTIV
jgi:hypothetical protein